MIKPVGNHLLQWLLSLQKMISNRFYHRFCPSQVSSMSSGMCKNISIL